MLALMSVKLTIRRDKSAAESTEISYFFQPAAVSLARRFDRVDIMRRKHAA